MFMYLLTSIFSSSGRHFRILNSGYTNTEATCILYISFVHLLVIKNGWARINSLNAYRKN